MGGLRNILFTVLVALLLTSVAGPVLYTSLADGVSAPMNSVLEGRAYAQLPTSGYRTLFFSGKLQSQFENYMSDAVPNKDRVMLAKAEAEKRTIALADLPFGYPAYHTFYGSDRVAVPSSGAVYRATANSEFYNDGFFELARSFFDGVLVNDDINWFYYLPESSEIAVANPAHDLVSEPVDYDCVASRFEELLGNRCTFVRNRCDGLEEYSNELYRTDHHFQIEGALDYYKTMCSALGKEPVHVGDVYEPLQAHFIGSNARSGLEVDQYDILRDVHYDIGNVALTANGESAQLTSICLQYSTSAYTPASPYENIYAKWFGGSSILEFENDDLPDEAGSLLVISDSYDDSSSRFFTGNYKHVYDIDPRTYSGGLPAIRDFISEHSDIDDAIIIISMDVYFQMQKAGVL